jgi:hypothetical protein
MTTITAVVILLLVVAIVVMMVQMITMMVRGGPRRWRRRRWPLRLNIVIIEGRRGMVDKAWQEILVHGLHPLRPACGQDPLCAHEVSRCVAESRRSGRQQAHNQTVSAACLQNKLLLHTSGCWLVISLGISAWSLTGVSQGCSWRSGWKLMRRRGSRRRWASTGHDCHMTGHTHTY